MTTTKSQPLERSLTYNLLEIWEKNKHLPGWKICQQQDLILLSSPTTIAELNFCLYPKNASHIKVCKDFFKGKDFCVINDRGTDLEFPNPLRIAMVKEMQMKVNPSAYFDLSPSIKVVSTPEELAGFSHVVADVFGFDQRETPQFYRPFVTLPHSKLLIYIEKGLVGGTGELYVDEKGLGGIYSIAVLEKFRYQGVGTKIMTACLHFARELGAKYYGLHASQAGASLYEKLGFQITRDLSYTYIKGN